MATTQQSVPSYAPPQHESLDARIVARFLERLASDPAVSDAARAALRSVLMARPAGRAAILAAVRDAHTQGGPRSGDAPR